MSIHVIHCKMLEMQMLWRNWFLSLKSSHGNPAVHLEVVRWFLYRSHGRTIDSVAEDDESPPETGAVVAEG